MKRQRAVGSGGAFVEQLTCYPPRKRSRKRASASFLSVNRTGFRGTSMGEDYLRCQDEGLTGRRVRSARRSNGFAR